MAYNVTTILEKLVISMEGFEDQIELLCVRGVWSDMNNKQFPELIELHYQYRALFNRYGIAEQLEAEYRGLA